ncbi:MAG: alpha/beta fold hydrolase [Oceanicaulis sp.]
MTALKMLPANLTARFAPETFKRAAGARFVTPRAKKQSDTGRDWLERLTPVDFDAPCGTQRAWTGGDGPLVVFQHGWEADSADLSTLGQAVMEAGFAVALIDGPAHGASTGTRAHMIRFADGLAAARHHFGEPFAVIAHSMGFPATVIAMTRFSLAPQRVVALGAPDALPRNVRFQARAMGLSNRAVELMLDAVSYRFGEDARALSVTADAPSMTIPALFCHGANDAIAPPEASERMAAAWPGSELQVFDGLGHRGVLRDKRVVARVVGFLGAE